jgi:hypothetical protein
MLLTEQQAENQRCIGPDNCGEERDGVRLCIASRCGMAWRWSGLAVQHMGHTGFELGRAVAEDHLHTGYCGLAGEPLHELLPNGAPKAE